jgi:crotonobetainyl-CoA:carnitine CoA-transferase CaiB-like acyl-CoA transferase
VTRPLEGLRVVDVTEGAQGPFAASLLADLGASVVKVERPGGELMRGGIGPRKRGVPLPLQSIARGRVASVVLDLKSQDGKRELLDLVREADVFIENWKAGTAERLGLSAGDMHALWPKLVYLSASGFGSSGPLAKRGSMDMIAAAAGGLASVSGPVGGPPERYRLALLDFISAMITAEMALAAIVLHQGEPGVHAETSQLEAAVTAVSAVLASATGGSDPYDGGPSGPSDRWVVPSSLFPCQHGQFIAVHAETRKQWQQLCAALGASSPDPQWDSAADRRSAQPEVEAWIGSCTTGMNAGDLSADLQARGVPAAVVRRSMAETLTDPKVADEHVVWRRGASVGWIAMARAPWTFSCCDVRASGACPDLGAAVRDDWRAEWQRKSD